MTKGNNRFYLFDMGPVLSWIHFITTTLMLVFIIIWIIGIHDNYILNEFAEFLIVTLILVISLVSKKRFFGDK